MLGSRFVFVGRGVIKNLELHFPKYSIQYVQRAMAFPMCIVYNKYLQFGYHSPYT